MTRNVTTHYRYQRPPRKRKAVALDVPAVVTRRARPSGAAAAPPPANDDGKPASHPTDRKKSAIVTTTSRKQLKLRRAERALGADDGREVSPEVKAFLARMIRPGGALRPKKF